MLSMFHNKGQNGVFTFRSQNDKSIFMRSQYSLAWGLGHVACHDSLDARHVATEMGLEGCSGVPPTSLPP